MPGFYVPGKISTPLAHTQGREGGEEREGGQEKERREGKGGMDGRRGERGKRRGRAEKADAGRWTKTAKAPEGPPCALSAAAEMKDLGEGQGMKTRPCLHL